MSFLLKDLKDEALELIQVEGAGGKLKRKGYDNSVIGALEIYSRDRPREIALDLTGDGSGSFALSSLTGYIDGFSGDVRIEYPIITDGEQYFLDPREYSMALTPTGKVIRLHSHKPNGASDKARFLYRVMHVVHADEIAQTTVPLSDKRALAKLVAVEICGLFASYHTHTGDGVLAQADVTYFKTKRGEFEARGKALRQEYANHIGKGDSKEVKAATVVKNLDLGPSAGIPGIGRLTHPRRYR